MSPDESMQAHYEAQEARWQEMADEVRAATIEECAKVADDTANERLAHPEYNMACWEIAAAVRSLATTAAEGVA